jgi:hypothetical protein
MATLTLASKANQASTLPVLVVASYANHADPNANTIINIEDADKLQNGSPIDYKSAAGESTTASQATIKALIAQHNHLQSSSQNLVSFSRLPLRVPVADNTVKRSMSG